MLEAAAQRTTFGFKTAALPIDGMLKCRFVPPVTVLAHSDIGTF